MGGRLIHEVDLYTSKYGIRGGETKDYRQLLHWQPVKIRVFSFLLKDSKLGAVLTENGSLFQIPEMTNEYEL